MPGIRTFLLSLTATCGCALAQEIPLEEVVVFGDFRETAIDDLPSSVSVIEAEQLTRRSARHLEDALALSANINMASGASRSRFFQVRGIGERGQFIEPLNPSVGVLIDGVDLSNAASALTLFDVEQIEVFRGPQGTRYGANALAGLINVRTRAPSQDTEAEIGVDAANYAGFTVNGALGGALSDSIAGRFAFQQHREDGFLDNTWLGADDTNSRDETALRGKLHWEAGAELSFDFMLGIVDVDNGYDAFSLENDRNTRSDEPGKDSQDTRLASLQAHWSGPERLAIEATLGLADSDSVYGYDEDWTYVGFHPFGYSSTDYYLRDRSTLTTEVRLLSEDAPRLLGGRASWVVGLYSLDAAEDLDRDYTFAAGRFSSQFDVRRLAAFAQIDVDLTATTRLSAGLRLERHESDYLDTDGAEFDPQDDLEGWRVGIDRSFGDAIMGYALLAGGYKAGGFNTNGSLPANLRTFEPEKSTSLELGIKGDFLDSRLLVRIALFEMERDDIQIDQSIVILRDDGSSEFIEYIDNGVTGTNAGLESEIEFRPGDRWSVHATLGLLETEYDVYVNPNGDDLSGRAQAHAPEYQFSLSTLRQIGESAWFEIAFDGRDAFYFSSSHNERSRSYTSVNAAFGFELGRWLLRAWGRNLTDEDIFTRGYYFGNDPRIDYEARPYTQLAEPRRFGIGASRTF